MADPLLNDGLANLAVAFAERVQKQYQESSSIITQMIPRAQMTLNTQQLEVQVGQVEFRRVADYGGQIQIQKPPASAIWVQSYGYDLGTEVNTREQVVSKVSITEENMIAMMAALGRTETNIILSQFATSMLRGSVSGNPNPNPSDFGRVSLPSSQYQDPNTGSNAITGMNYQKLIQATLQLVNAYAVTAGDTVNLALDPVSMIQLTLDPQFSANLKIPGCIRQVEGMDGIEINGILASLACNVRIFRFASNSWQINAANNCKQFPCWVHGNLVMADQMPVRVRVFEAQRTFSPWVTYTTFMRGLARLQDKGLVVIQCVNS